MVKYTTILDLVSNRYENLAGEILYNLFFTERNSCEFNFNVISLPYKNLIAGTDIEYDCGALLIIDDEKVECWCSTDGDLMVLFKNDDFCLVNYDAKKMYNWE